MFENKAIGDIFVTMFIASWLKVGGQLRCRRDIKEFNKWLLSLGINKDDINYIINLATCGKLELETSAKKFIKRIEYGFDI